MDQEDRGAEVVIWKRLHSLITTIQLTTTLLRWLLLIGTLVLVFWLVLPESLDYPPLPL